MVAEKGLFLLLLCNSSLQFFMGRVGLAERVGLGGGSDCGFHGNWCELIRRNQEELRAEREIGRMIEEMPYITEHLTSLRQEIADLRNLNARFTEKGDHSTLDQTALELRTNRLREIKRELSQMLNRPDDPKVWWERSRRQQQSA